MAPMHKLTDHPYRLALAAFDVADDYAFLPNIANVVCLRKGDIWRSKTGERYTENIVKWIEPVDYALGFGPAIDLILKNLQDCEYLRNVAANCRELEVQVLVSLDDDCRVPHVHFTSQQLNVLGSIGASIDCHIA